MAGHGIMDVAFDDLDAPGGVSETPLLGTAEMDEDIGELEESKPGDMAAEVFGVSEEVGGEGSDAEVSVPVVEGVPPLGTRKYAHEEPHMESWKRHNKHFFVLSSAGKPVYSRYGDESLLAGFMGVLQAIVSFIEDDDDTMRGMVAGEHQITHRQQVAFLIRGPLYFVCVAKTHEPFSQLTQQLGYLHDQILSVLTSSVSKILNQKYNFDIRNLLGGTEKFLDSLATWMDHDPALIMSAIHCLRLPRTQAEWAEQQSIAAPDFHGTWRLTFVQLLHSYCEAPARKLAFRTSETWTPLCLPKFNDVGFLHLYLNFIAPDVCLVLISTKADHFYQLSQVKNAVVQRFEQAGVFQELAAALEHQYYRVREIGIPHLVHFVYKSIRTSQITCPVLEAPYVNRHERKRLFRLYQRLHRRVQPKGSKPHSVYYLTSDTETVLIWTSSGFILCATFGPLTSLKKVITGCNQLIRWIKQEETTIFVIDSPMFS